MVKRRAAIYARFSSHNQRSESIEIQVDAGTRYIAENGLELVKIYADYAKTGRNTDRREYKQMMNDARLGLFDYVVIYKVPRIMRNRDEMALTRIMLRKAGVESLNVFIYADDIHRAVRASEITGCTNATELQRMLARRDSRRHNYYTHYTGKKWGDSHNYHLSLDSGALGYDLCVKLIVEAAKSME